ncbi:MAG: hypothetical protein JF887_11115 [Candidatus Dormibacteraeota bacterium]|uniref:Uncharacterized protein n=1 Tax=Candidatus Amunia macphersoniae TaxID=3127014 RepID=A0A934KQG3_9BACT|nr:hypothetical protein [Candidatus Dormibacteraeota bacterium]
MHLISDLDIAGHPVNTAVLSVFLAFLLAWIAAYLVYKMFWHSDFGLPVRRRLLCTRMKIQRDQMAVVPLWWSDLQIQRAVSAHWKNSLRSTVARAPGRDRGDAPAR